MKAINRKNWKRNALSASVLAVSTVVGYSSISSVAADPAQQTIPTTPSAPQGRGGRGGRGGGENHLQGMSTSPPAVELAPAESSVESMQSTELVDVLIANYPRSTYESDIITRNALPTLISEAIEAQDANVNFVSRATDSSRAFVQSLDSALLDAAIGMDL